MSIKTFGGRKFLLATLITILTFLLIIYNRLGADDYLKVIFSVLGLYTGLNVYQKMKKNGGVETIKKVE